MKRFITILIIISLTFTVGCWDRREIVDLAIVVGLALDKGEKPDEVVSTIQIANSQAFLPGGISGNNNPFWTATGRGKTVREAIKQMDYRIPRALIFGQNRLLIIGEEAAREGINLYLDRIWRSPDVRANIYVSIAKGTGKDILEVVMPTFQSSAMAMVSLFNLGNRGAIIPITLAEFAHDLGASRGGAVAPMVAVVKQSSETAGEDPLPTILVKNLAIFNSDGKMVGQFNEEETSGFTWIREKVDSVYVRVPSPEKVSNDQIYLECKKSKAKTTVKLDEDGLPRFEIQVQAQVDVTEYFGEGGGGLSDKWFVNRVEKRVNTRIEQDIMAAVKKAKFLNSDVFLFGEEVRRQHMDAWNGNLKDRWEDLFPLVQVKVNVKTKIADRGISSNPPSTIMEENQ